MTDDPAAPVLDGAPEEAQEQKPEPTTDDALEAGPGPGFELPLLRLELGGAPINVGRNPDTGDRAIIVGPVLLQVIIPLDADASRTVARELTGGIEIASAVPVRGGKQLIRR